MGNYIVKITPDEDLYVVWSEFSEEPVCWGPRAFVENEYLDDLTQVAPDRFDRADRNGTSANWVDWPEDRLPYRWGDEVTFIYRQKGILRRGNLLVALERLSEVVDADICDLLEAFDDSEMDGEGPRCNRQDCTWSK